MKDISEALQNSYRSAAEKKHSSPEAFGGSLRRSEIENRNRFLQEMEFRHLKQKYLKKRLA